MKMKKTNNIGRFSKRLKVAGLMGTLALANSAQAGMVWVFEESGSGATLLTTATASGSFSVDVGLGASASNTATLVYSYAFGVLGGNFNHLYIGDSSTTDVTGAAVSLQSGTFGFNGGTLYWDPLHGTTLLANTDIGSDNSVVTPTLTFSAGVTIADLFGGIAPTENITAWTLIGGSASDTIEYSFATVPEPSSSSLILLSGLTLVCRRNRTKSA